MITADRSSTSTATPTLRREGITWRNLGDMVELSIEISNDDFEATEPQSLVIEAAAFGAFIPHVPVARVAVGSLDPGERRTVTTTVNRRLLDPLSPALDWQGLFAEVREAFVDGATAAHWIGNFNVYFDRRPDLAVERHAAFGLKVPAGCTLFAMFILYGGGPFEVSLDRDQRTWTGTVKSAGTAALLNLKCPEGVAEHCHVRIHVTREADGAYVPVEFDFETVDGWGETVGCVKV